MQIHLTRLRRAGAACEDVGVKVTMMLADAAQAVDGKLYILGGGWSITGPEPSASAIAAYIQVPWDRTNVQHEFRFELVDSDGQPVVAETPEGIEEPVAIEGAFEVGRPVGVTPGTPIDVPLAINIGPLVLPPGGRYEWRLTVDGETSGDWRLAFSTRPAA
jgi:hypothetical protein